MVPVKQNKFVTGGKKTLKTYIKLSDQIEMENVYSVPPDQNYAEAILMLSVLYINKTNLSLPLSQINFRFTSYNFHTILKIVQST